MAATPPPLSPLNTISPADGRYIAQTNALRDHFSESALIQKRIEVELRWLETIAPILNPALAGDELTTVIANIRSAATEDGTAEKVKEIEKITRHDVKAIEYWIGQQLDSQQRINLTPYVHFACTSWDINNVALALQISGALNDVMLPALRQVQDGILAHAKAHAAQPMLARTHGQPASPTTLGKEFANFHARLAPRLQRLAATRLPAKFNGAVGNYNAHIAAHPTLDWPAIARDFIEQKNGLQFASHTTQIEPYDDLADLFDLLRRINTILLDLCRDCWGYIAIEYFVQRTGDNPAETGSSTMPHKINPIDFENAEGNLGIANALLAHFADKLPVSRWQRDLSDSTVLRAIGNAFAHTLIAWKATATGLTKIHANPQRLAADLNDNWAVLTEAVQTVLRSTGKVAAYEKLKEFSRGKHIDATALGNFIKELNLPEEEEQRLLALTPASYIGLAHQLTEELINK